MHDKTVDTYLRLYNRLSKQPYNKICNKKILVLVGRKTYKTRLVFINNGTDFYLEVTEEDLRGIKEGMLQYLKR